MHEDFGSTAQRQVDTRFLLANERTLLAWVRTALTLMGGGGAVEQFGTHFHARRPLAVTLILLGVAAAATGGLRYLRADRAIRRGAQPPTGRELYALSAVLALVGVGLLVATLTAR